MPIYWQQKFSVFLSFSLFLILVLLSFSVLLRQFLGLLRHPRVSFVNFWVFFVIPVSPSSVSASPSSSPCLLHQFLCLLRYSRASFVIPSSSSLSSCLLRHSQFFFVILVSSSSSSVQILLRHSRPLFFYRHSRIYLFSSFPRRRESSTVHKSISHFPINEPTLALVCDRSITIVKY